MKKVIWILGILVFLSIICPIKAEIAPEEVKQEVLKQWDFIISFVETEYGTSFKDKQEIEKCTLSAGLRYLPLNPTLLVDNEINSLKQLEISTETKEYLFFVEYDDKGILLIEIFDDKGNYSLGRIGGKANAFYDALKLMEKLVGEKEFNLYRVALDEYLLTYEYNEIEYLIPFSSSDKLAKEYYEVNNIKQLPTVQEYLKLQKEKCLQKITEIEEYRRKNNTDDILYGIDLHVELLPKKDNSALVYSLIAIFTLAMLVFIYCRKKIKK